MTWGAMAVRYGLPYRASCHWNRPPYDRPLVPIVPSYQGCVLIHLSVSCPSGPSSRYG